MKLAAPRKWTFTAFACNTQMHLYGLYGALKPLTTFSCCLWASACFVSKFKSFSTFGQREWGWTKDLNRDPSLNQLLTTSWGIWSGTSDSMKWGKTCRKWKLNFIKRQTEMSRLLCTISASTKRFKRDTLMTRNRWRTILRSTTNLKSRIQFISTALNSHWTLTKLHQGAQSIVEGDLYLSLHFPIPMISKTGLKVLRKRSLLCKKRCLRASP